MVARIWSSGIVSGKESEYLAFANEVSVPMFKGYPIKAVYILTSGQKTKVITIWNNKDDIFKMECSENYNETVKKILASGLVEGNQEVEVWECPIQFIFGLISQASCL